ncbi:MAG TPA: UDP-glucose 4-epimerase GalE [Burkholderiales bacterium]|nr:UDP-glucose 4-epimerase GalE [Burkholderiales bacterium]
MSTILVTGGAGYVGSHACKALAAAGHTPVVYDNLSRGHREFARWGPLEVGDIGDAARLDAVFARHRVDAVMHFAALAYVGESVSEPALYYRNNVGGTLELLEAMRRAGVRRLVFSSTCATYGVPERMPITEDLPQQPINPYGMSKLVVERMLRDYDAAYGLRSVSLRYFNAAGCDPDGEVGEDHDPETHLIPRVLMAADGALPHVEIFGTDYSTPDGTCLRDYVHVADLAEGHVQALGYLERGGATTAINLGTGRAFSVREVIAAAERVTGRRVPVREAARRAGDPPVLVADAARARAVLGFAPRFTEIEPIVETAWRWHKRKVRR